MVPARGSPKTVEASSNETPWTFRFRAALAAFHSNFTDR
jgi:hypothetical protein